MFRVYVHHSHLDAYPDLPAEIDEFINKNCGRVRRKMYDKMYMQTTMTQNGEYRNYEVKHLYYEYNFKYEADSVMFKLQFHDHVATSMEKYNRSRNALADARLVETFR